MEKMSIDKVVGYHESLLQHHSSHVHRYDLTQGFVWIWHSIFCGFGIWREQNSQGQILIAGKLGNLESSEGEFVGFS
jgi:hypothetical protein